MVSADSKQNERTLVDCDCVDDGGSGGDVGEGTDDDDDDNDDDDVGWDDDRGGVSTCTEPVSSG